MSSGIVHPRALLACVSASQMNYQRKHQQSREWLVIPAELTRGGGGERERLRPRKDWVPGGILDATIVSGWTENVDTSR